MVSAPLVVQEKILMPSLLINLGLIKQLSKALDKESEAFKQLVTGLLKLSEANIRV